MSSKRLGRFAFLVPANRIIPVSSHAASEVKTSKGWLAVDNSTNFIGIDNNLKIYTYKEAEKSNSKIKLPKSIIFENKIFTLIGLYSRKGNYYEPYLPLMPEINFKDFMMNFNINIKII